jgi:hypothetical protein
MKISLGSRTSGRKLLKRAIWELIYEPKRHWPDDSYFHRRNREKLSRAWRSLEELHDRRPQEVVQLYVDLLNQRASASTTTIYLMSNGGSGSHFMGALLDGLPEFTTTDEIYFPPDLLTEAHNSRRSEAHRVVDFINFFHTASADQESAKRIVVNIGQLRRDAPPEILRQLDPAGRFVLLLRNPYDVAVSRAFRKPEYRQQVAPGVSDDEYLARQVSGTYSFLSFAATQRWDRIVRYEDLRSNPTAVIGDIVRELGIDFDANLFEKVRAQHDARRKAANDDRDTPGNLNLDPPPALTDTQRAILNDGLQALALQYGYQAEAAYYW